MKISVVIIIYCILWVIVGVQVQGQVSKPNTIEAYQTNEKIKIDGNLSEPVWAKAESISNFTQRELYVGEPATEKTEVKILYDKKNLYIGVWCFDDMPDKITASQLNRVLTRVRMMILRY